MLRHFFFRQQKERKKKKKAAPEWRRDDIATSNSNPNNVQTRLSFSMPMMRHHIFLQNVSMVYTSSAVSLGNRQSKKETHEETENQKFNTIWKMSGEESTTNSSKGECEPFDHYSKLIYIGIDSIQIWIRSKLELRGWLKQIICNNNVTRRRRRRQCVE